MGHPFAEASSAQLWYRYWFYGWLFVDASRGSAGERAAARRLNRSRCHWLPTYLRRWTLLGAWCYAAGALVEPLAPGLLAPALFAVGAVTVPINAVTLAAWIGLRVLPSG